MYKYGFVASIEAVGGGGGTNMVEECLSTRPEVEGMDITGNHMEEVCVWIWGRSTSRSDVRRWRV
jgi:hypothetical protein